MSSGSGASLSGMTEKQTFTVGAGDDLITYDVRGDLSSGVPLFMFASPMDASGLRQPGVALRGPAGRHLRPARRPAATRRAPRPSRPSSTATDLHRVVQALGVGPVDAFGSSGGGVNLLALCAAHPEDVRTAVVARAADLRRASRTRRRCSPRSTTSRRRTPSSGNGPAMAKFIQLVMATEELPGRLPRPARPGPGDVRPVERGRRQPGQPADAQHARGQRLRGRRRCAGGSRATGS